MLYSLSGSDDHPLGRLQAVRHEACRDAMYRGDIHAGDFDANAMNRDDFYFTDVIESFCLPVFNARFKQACETFVPGAVEFHPVRLLWGKENLLEWVGRPAPDRRYYRRRSHPDALLAEAQDVQA